MTAPFRTGDVLAGKYRVERVLGQGGMGVVVAARHVRLGERVAIKFPVARLSARGDVVARLVREGRAAMRIRSEHVARVHDVGTLDTGEPFLVMEYLEGRDLGAVVAADGPLPIEAAVEYVLQVSEALAEAHAMGIIHRDLKPSNLFLSRRADGSPVVKVIDFGISKDTGSTGGDADGLITDSAAVVGSPLYMSPEQMRSARQLDARSDIWALGATLHALVTGAPPFPAGSLLDIHELIVRGAPGLRGARADAPAALEAIVLRCLQRDPADRYATIADLAEALGEIAPEHARASARRVARILQAGPRESDVAASSSASVLDAAPELALARTEAPAEASWRDATRAGPAPVSPDGAPPSTAPVTGARSRSGVLWVSALTVAAVGGGALVLALLGGRRPAATTAIAPTSDAASLAATGAVVVEPAPSSSAAAAQAPPSAPEPSSSASANRVPSRPRSVSPRSTGPARAPGASTAAAPGVIRPRDPLADPD